MYVILNLAHETLSISDYYSDPLHPGVHIAFLSFPTNTFEFTGCWIFLLLLLLLMHSPHASPRTGILPRFRGDLNFFFFVASSNSSFRALHHWNFFMSQLFFFFFFIWSYVWIFLEWCSKLCVAQKGSKVVRLKSSA